MGIDTPVFIYHFEGHAHYLPLTQELFAGVERGQWQAVSSMITLMEIAVQPYRLGR